MDVILKKCKDREIAIFERGRAAGLAERDDEITRLRERVEELDVERMRHYGDAREYQRGLAERDDEVERLRERVSKQERILLYRVNEATELERERDEARALVSKIRAAYGRYSEDWTGLADAVVTIIEQNAHGCPHEIGTDYRCTRCGEDLREPIDDEPSGKGGE